MAFRLVKLTAITILAAVLLWACQSEPAQPTPLQVGTVVPTASATPPDAALQGTSTPAPTPADSPLVPASKDRFGVVDPKGQKIVYWHAQSGKNQAALEKIVKDFNASNPEGILVETVGQGSENAIFEKMQPLLNSGDQPGLLDASQNHAAIYQLSSDLEDLNGLVTSAKWGLTVREYNDFPSGVMAQDIHTVFVGARLGFPVSRSMGVLYANLDWLKELGLSEGPQTPEDFKTAVCRAAKQPFSKRSAQDGAVVGLVIPKDAHFFVPLINAFGGDIFGTANNFYTLGTDPVVKSAGFIQELVKGGCVQLSPDTSTARKQFGLGQALFLSGSTDDLSLISAPSAGNAQFAWTVAPLPHQGQDPVMTAAGMSISIPKSSPEKELAAWLFVKYLTSPTVQAEWAAASGYLPVRGAAREGLAGYFTQFPAYKTAFDLLKYSKPEPPVPGSDQVRDQIDLAFIKLVSPSYPDTVTVLGKVNQDANQALQALLAKRK